MSQGVRIAMAVPAAVAALFVAAWGDGVGVPTWLPWSFYHQLRAVESVCLLAVLPWLAQRALTGDTRAELTHLSAFTGLPPSRLLALRALASYPVVALAGLIPAPAAVLALRMSGGSLSRLPFDESLWLAAAALAVALATWTERHRDTLTGWGLATLGLGLTGLALRAFAPLPAALVTLVLAGAVLATACAHADRVDLYDEEPRG